MPNPRDCEPTPENLVRDYMEIWEYFIALKPKYAAESLLADFRAAVAAETERCAKIAKEFLSLPDTPCVTVEAVKTAIAAAIRRGAEDEDE